MEYCSNSVAETEALGEELARRLEPGAVVAFSGDLGAGKTAFVRGMAQTWPPLAAWQRAPAPACVRPTQHALPAFSSASRGSLTVRNNALLSQECWN